MGRQDQKVSMACSEIAGSLLALSALDGNRARREIRKACAKYSLARIPGNHEILSYAHGEDFERLRRVLIKKPAKTASGVAVVALMPKPYACPHGRCTYCPGGIQYNTPNSYTGLEPSSINAIENGYDPSGQITSKIAKLKIFGHDTSKMELVVVGGTFMFMPSDYREWFVKSCYDALNGTPSGSLEEAKTANESASTRNVGFAIETKPDYCKRGHVDDMLRYGVTRIEIGVQSLREEVYSMVNRGHTYSDVQESFQTAKDAGYKIAAHMMPGLPTMTPKEDVKDFAKLFEDPDLRPDMLKIYPSLVVKGTPLHDEYVRGSYRPYSDEEMIWTLAEAKKRVPKWVRIMRVQREISPNEIAAGPKSGNLRQLVHLRLRDEGESCRCIRCREAGLSRVPDGTEPSLARIDYDSSGGQETFLSYEDGNESVYGFLRMRAPGDSHRREIGSDSCIVRELHVYGRSLRIGRKEKGQIQHSGIGKRLMGHAEEIAAGEFDARRLLVISAVGTREYYRGMGYLLRGPYMEKRLDA